MNHQTSRVWLGEVEIMRGIAIIAVILIHLTGLPVRALVAGSLSHTFYAVLNSFVQFAVPAFMFISALVLTYGTRKKEDLDWKQFYRKRWWQVVVPYLVWTLVYAAYRVATTPSGVHEVQSLKYWAFWLVFGKAYYHLYYLSIIIQFYVFFPVLFWFLQRIRWNLSILLPVALAAQVAIYWGNRLYFYHVFPYARPFIWYLFVIAAGMWVGGNYQRFTRTMGQRRCLAAVALLAAASGAGYIVMSVANARGVLIDTFIYQMLWYFYVTAFSTVLLVVSQSLVPVKSAVTNFLRLAGTVSFGVYLVHPLFLAEWRRLVVLPANPLMFEVALWTSFGLVMVLSFGLVVGLRQTRWNRLLFGR